MIAAMYSFVTTYTYSDVEAFVLFKSKKVSLSFQMARVYTNE